jgi:hypothetical protein
MSFDTPGSVVPGASAAGPTIESLHVVRGADATRRGWCYVRFVSSTVKEGTNRSLISPPLKPCDKDI